MSAPPSSSRSSVEPPARRGGRILVADDDRLARAQVARILEAAGFEVIQVQDGQAAVERAAQGDLDLVLLDVVMPRLSGLEACRLLKGMWVERFLPIILVTVRTDPSSRVEGLRIGADDYVCKPFDESELIARIGAMLRIKDLHEHVQRARAKLEELSVMDPLTGVYNYRHLHTRLQEEFRRAERYQEPLACLVVDVDHLSTYNQLDRRLGDLALKKVAEILKPAVRDVDVVARLGEDEFILVLPNTHFVGSVKVAERIWRSADSVGRTVTAQGPKLSLSIGAAMYPSRDVRTKESLLRGAEAALREAKLAGGNRVCVFQQRGYVYTAASGNVVSQSESMEQSTETGQAPGGQRP